MNAYIYMNYTRTGIDVPIYERRVCVCVCVCTTHPLTVECVYGGGSGRVLTTHSGNPTHPHHPWPIVPSRPLPSPPPAVPERRLGEFDCLSAHDYCGCGPYAQQCGTHVKVYKYIIIQYFKANMHIVVTQFAPSCT